MSIKSRLESVVVVGSGVIGIACAHYLSQAGMRVTVIDKGGVAGACSYGNCGYLCPSHVLPLTEPGAVKTALTSLFKPDAPFRIKPRFSPALWHWMCRFALRCRHRPMIAAGHALKAILDSSLREYQRLIAESSLDCEWRPNGLLYVFETDDGLHEFAETDRLLTEEFGVTARRIEGPDLPAFDPALKDGLAGAFHYEGDVAIRPDRLNSAWTERLKQQGVEFQEHCELLSLGKTSGRVTHLETSQGPMTAEAVVMAVGAWSSKLSSMLECRIPVEPGKGYSVTMDRPEPCPRHAMLFPEHRVGVSPFETGYRLGSMMEFAGFDESIPERRIQQLKDSAKPYLVTPCGGGREETWYGWRPMTWDSVPIIGAVPRLENVYLATGHNMLGMSLATATGRLVMEMLTGQPPHIDPTPYRVTRF